MPYPGWRFQKHLTAGIAEAAEYKTSFSARFAISAVKKTMSYENVPETVLAMRAGMGRRMRNVAP